MGKRVDKHPRTIASTETVKIDREKLTEYARSIGHSETSLSAAYASGTYLSHRFTLYDGTIPKEFITWCGRIYPASQDKLIECIIREPEPEPPKREPEQMKIELPSVLGGDKVVRVQPVSLVGINQVVEALNRISERLEALERAWNGREEVSE